MSVNIISLNQIVDLFSDFAQRHYFLNDFGFGPTSDIGTSRQMDFPYLWLTLNEDSTINPQNRTSIPEISFSILLMDKINNQSNYENINGLNSDNQQEVMSDMLQILQDFITDVQVEWGNYGIIFQDQISFYPAIDETTDKVTGVVGQFRFKLKHSNCITPLGDIVQTNLSPINPMTRYLTCETVTGCTSLQEYIAEQIALVPTITGGTFDDGTLTLVNSNGGEVEITGFTTEDIYTTGGTYFTGGTIIFDYNNSSGFTVTGLTQDLDNAIAELAETDELTIELDVPTNKIRLKDVVAPGTGGSRTFEGDIIIDGFLNINDIGSGSPIINLGLDSNNQVVTGTTNQTVTITGGTDIEIVGTYPNFGVNFTGTTSGDYLPLSGGTVTGNTTFTSGLTVNTIDFNTTATTTDAIGRLKWNDTDGTLDLGLKGGDVTLQIGQEEVIRVVNKTGSNLLESQYKVVRIRTQAEGGAQGQRLAVLLAQADTKANHSGILGVVTENINNNQEGFITSFGTVRKINTTGSLQGETWLDGDDLWLSDTVTGGLTNIEPTTHPVRIGYVLYSHAVNGKIFVSLDNGVDELGELHDVTITSPIGGDTLQYNSTLSVWENSNPFWTIDLMDNSSVEFYAVDDVKINTITNIVGSPTITIADDGAPYTLTNTILSGSKITVTSDIQSVIKLNIEY